jgi:N-glycosidase YbiA
MGSFDDAKFSSPVLAEKLLFTHPRQLIEESNTDAFWGLGKKGNGRNMLGVLLMETRERIHARAIGDL